MRTLQSGIWLMLVCLGFAGAAASRDNTIVLNAEQIDHLGIRVVRPEPVNALPLARVPGRVVLPPAKEFVVSAAQAGLIARVNVPLGVRVAKGEVLAEIRSPELLSVQRQLLDAATEFALADARLKRDRTLLDEGIISRLRWQETQSNHDKAKAALRTAEQTLAAYGVADQDIRRVEIGRTLDSLLKVRSPTDGVVLERMAVVGQRVDTLAPLFRIGKLDELWVEIDMPQERLHEVRIGDWVTSELPEARARIIEISQSVNPANQSALVRAVVEDGAKDLRPGMNLNVQLMHRSTDRIFRVPVAAVFSYEGRNYVFVRTAQGFEARQVAVAGQEAYHAVIHEGLKDGEEVAAQGVAGLKAVWLGVGEDQ